MPGYGHIGPFFSYNFSAGSTRPQDCSLLLLSPMDSMCANCTDNKLNHACYFMWLQCIIIVAKNSLRVNSFHAGYGQIGPSAAVFFSRTYKASELLSILEYNPFDSMCANCTENETQCACYFMWLQCITMHYLIVAVNSSCVSSFHAHEIRNNGWIIQKGDCSQSQYLNPMVVFHPFLMEIQIEQL